MTDRWIAEATECDFKVALEVRRPKSWLKSVSAFANGIGGTLFFGIDNDRNAIGLVNAQTDAEAISQLIKERITPYPEFVLTPKRENGKDILVLSVSAGRSTPYYYKADGVTEAYIRVGNESVMAPAYVLNQLILKGMNRTYDALISEYRFEDYAFSKLRERYKVWTQNSMEDKLFDSFGIRNSEGILTNAGALLADDSPIRHSRLFCTRWNGLDKSGGIIDALDSAEYSGSLILLLDEGVAFVKRNMKTRWKKTPGSRIEMPEYCERSVLEALVNALIHRDYLIFGSEVHIDIYDDRLTICSPGGMADGTRIQERNIFNIASVRRNPVLADIFGRLGYMERQGSGFKKITESYRTAHNYREGLEPTFYSDASSFQVTLYNLNYDVPIKNADNKHSKVAIEEPKVAIEEPKVAIEEPKVAIEESKVAIEESKVAIEESKVAIEESKVAIEEPKVAIEEPKVAIEEPKVAIEEPKVAIEELKVAIEESKVAIEVAIDGLNTKQPTKNKLFAVFGRMGFTEVFGRTEVAQITGDSITSAGNLIKRLNDAGLIQPVLGKGKGKYRFIILKK